MAFPLEIGSLPICVICVICGQEIRLPVLIGRSRLIVISQVRAGHDCNLQSEVCNPIPSQAFRSRQEHTIA